RYNPRSPLALVPSNTPAAAAAAGPTDLLPGDEHTIPHRFAGRFRPLLSSASFFSAPSPTSLVTLGLFLEYRASDLLHGKRRRGRGSRSGAEGRCTERDHDHQRIRLRLPFLQIIMARRPLATRTRRRNMTLRNILTSVLLMYYYVWLLMALAYRRKCLKIERRLRIKERRAENLNDLIGSDTKCISELRMDRRTFYILCEMVRDVGGLKATRNMTLEEIVAQFLGSTKETERETGWHRIEQYVILVSGESPS
ncbi:hypothetical protein EJB05_27120, partial [Eragrostis curvula]